MVGMIASRRAGKTLLAIILALALPICLLGALYFRQAVQVVRVLEREIQGVEAARIASGTLLAPEQSLPKESRARIATLESRLGLTGQDRFDALGQDAPANAFARYFPRLGEASGLILDGDPMSYHLADALFAELPQVLEDHQALLFSITAPAAADARLAAAQQSYGRLSASLGRLRTALEAAGHTSSANGGLSPQSAALARLAATSSEAGAALLQSGGLSPDIGPQHAALFAQTREGAQALMADGLRLLENRLLERRSALYQELFAIAAAGLACGLLAMLLSTYMFRRMLVRLDELEALHEAAQSARRETDRINADVAALNRELSDKVLALGEAQSEIVRKGRMEQLGQLTATIAHELRNPLGAVRTSAFLIERKTAGKGVDIEQQLQRISSGIKRCDDIISQLLDFSRARQLAAAPADLDEWLARTVSEEAAKLPPQLIVECTLGLGGRHVSFDGTRLSRAIVNLMNNAADAMTGTKPDGSPAGVTSPTLWISTFERGGDVVIRTRDNGPGIVPENLSRVREPLFTTKSFGTGLGIPAAEQIAAQHGGRLEIESVLGEGACFDIILPARRGAERRSASS